MKIAISGSACSGKTTLGTELARRLELAFIPEHFDTLFNLSPEKRNGKNPRMIADALKNVLELKQAEEGKHQDYVVDRCPLDLLNLWLSQGMVRHPRMTEVFYNACRRMVGHYDLVIILPWGRLPLEPLHTDTGRQVRNLNPWALFHSHATILGLARLCLRRGQLMVLPADIDSVADRVNYVLRRLKQGPQDNLPAH